MRLTIDFSKLVTLDAIKAEMLAFLKANAIDIGTLMDLASVVCEIHEKGTGAGHPVRQRYGLFPPGAAAVFDSLAGQIASNLAEYAQGKDGRVYSGAMIEIQLSRPGGTSACDMPEQGLWIRLVGIGFRPEHVKSPSA